MLRALHMIWILALLAALQIAYYYPRLPDRVASHFGVGGQPDDWLSKGAFVLLYFMVILSCALIFAYLPTLLRRTSPSLINLPNKDYWLAAERREQTFAFLTEQMRWFGAATLMLTLLIIQLVINANLGPAQQLASQTAWLLLAAYLVYTVLWIIRLSFRFRKTIA